MDRVVHQACRKEISGLKRRVADQQGQLQACAEQMVALQTQLKQEQLERYAPGRPPSSTLASAGAVHGAPVIVHIVSGNP